MRTLSPMDLRAGTCSEFILTTIFSTAFDSLFLTATYSVWDMYPVITHKASYTIHSINNIT